jgi:methylthioribose-1-phosphate isomerase
MSQRPHQETLESIKYDPATRSLKLLDQRLLPHTTTFDEVSTVQDVHAAIREMRVRGAPAIAVTAALGVAVAANNNLANMTSVADAVKFLNDSLDFVASSRPTAVNLGNAVKQFKARIGTSIAPHATVATDVVDKFLREAEEFYREDVSINEAIMRFGASHIMARGNPDRKVNILTICNTGALATCRYGTALGVVRQLHYDNRLERVYSLETRPWNQGSRLTVFECVTENIPVTLLVDSAASALMSKTKIDAVIVGADRVCANGDTANKIGTYHVAVSAKYHGVPFYVAAPTTTMDATTATGADVIIEEREPREITHGSHLPDAKRIVAEGDSLQVWNPVFDITPASLITGGIISEKGVIEPQSNGVFNIPEVLAKVA